MVHNRHCRTGTLSGSPKLYDARLPLSDLRLGTCEGLGSEWGRRGAELGGHTHPIWGCYPLWKGHGVPSEASPRPRRLRQWGKTWRPALLMLSTSSIPLCLFPGQPSGPWVSIPATLWERQAQGASPRAGGNLYSGTYQWVTQCLGI